MSTEALAAAALALALALLGTEGGHAARALLPAPSKFNKSNYKTPMKVLSKHKKLVLNIYN